MHSSKILNNVSSHLRHHDKISIYFILVIQFIYNKDDYEVSI